MPPARATKTPVNQPKRETNLTRFFTNNPKNELGSRVHTEPMFDLRNQAKRNVATQEKTVEKKKEKDRTILFSFTSSKVRLSDLHHELFLLRWPRCLPGSRERVSA